MPSETQIRAEQIARELEKDAVMASQIREFISPSILRERLCLESLDAILAEYAMLTDRFLPTGIELQVCDDIAKRQRLGINKYGTTVAKNPLVLKEWLRHHYEELLDAAVYARRAIDEIERKEREKAVETLFNNVS